MLQRRRIYLWPKLWGSGRKYCRLLEWFSHFIRYLTYKIYKTTTWTLILKRRFFDQFWQMEAAFLRLPFFVCKSMWVNHLTFFNTLIIISKCLVIDRPSPESKHPSPVRLGVLVCLLLTLITLLLLLLLHSMLLLFNSMVMVNLMEPPVPHTSAVIVPSLGN